MRATATTAAPAETPADTVAVGVFDGEEVAHDTPGGELGALLASGEARRSFRHLALAHAGGKRWLVVGLGSRERFDPERARLAATAVQARARELGARALCWELPHHVEDAVAAGLVEGTLLSAYRFERHRAPAEDGRAPELEELVVSAHHDVSEAVERAALVAGAANAARDLANEPANMLTPARLGERARELASGIDGLRAEVRGRGGIDDLGMGAFAAVAQGSEQEPALITLRWEPPDAAPGPALGLVGKAVTFDSGGLSLKPAAKMHEMKFDMAGGAAVLQAVGAIARLRLPVRVIGVLGATENLPSGRAVKPGDVVTASNGVTIEVTNTDAEGRLVLADCLVHAARQGANRLVDVATLTGGVVVALGSTYAGLMADDDGWAGELLAASAASGEELWRLPLHDEYAELMKGRWADLVNSAEERKATAIQGAEFLRRFTGDLPWAHVDIAGVGYNRGRPYAAKGGSGFGVRLLVELARRVAQAGAA